MAAEIQDLKKPEGLVKILEYDINEAQLLYDLSGLIVEDFIPAITGEEDAAAEESSALLLEKLRNPGFKRALLQVSYQRANPDVSKAAIGRMFAAANNLELSALLGELDLDVDDDAAGDGGGVLPPALTTEPDGSSPRSSVENTRSSGPDSTTNSDAPEDQPEATGTPV